MIVFSLFITSFYSFADSQPVKNKTIMLILGSAETSTLKARVDIAYQLYESAVYFDYIIVSGGCGAHRSKICEASEMARLLQEKGVPAEKIFKEEKSKNTVQNYVYSRILRKEDGTKLINEHDSLYVVSNHWHAISVAARFTSYDHVNAVYHIEGNILPSANDKVDYTNIYHKSSNNEEYVSSALWPLVDASYSIEGLKQQDNDEGKIYCFIGDRVYEVTDEGIKKESSKKISEMIAGLPKDWDEGIDASFYNAQENKVYLFKGSSYLRFAPNTKSIDLGYPKLIKDWVKDLPANWQGGYLDAAFFNPHSNELFLFKGEEYLQVSQRDRKINHGFPKRIKNLVSNWPFEWGSGDIDAAHYNNIEKMIYLFRGKEYLKIPAENKSSAFAVEGGYPRNIK